jgi:hypothetical protein
MVDRIREFLKGLVDDGNNAAGATGSDLRDWTIANATAAEELLKENPHFIHASLNTGAVVAVDNIGDLWLTYQSTKTNKWVSWEALPPHPRTA